MSKATARQEKPLPRVGDRVKLDYGESNRNAWPCAGEVRGIVDNEMIIVRRWIPRRRAHHYEAIDAIAWAVQSYRILDAAARPGEG